MIKKYVSALRIAVCLIFLFLFHCCFVFSQEPAKDSLAPAPQAKESAQEISEMKPRNLSPADLEKSLSKKISLDLRDINILDVLKFLALKGDFNIVTSKNVAGKVSLFLNSVSIRDAMDIILLANELGYVNKNGIIYVMTETEYQAAYGRKFSDNRQVEITKLAYASPTYAFSVLDTMRSTLGKVIIDEGTGVVVMIDTAEKIKEMKEAIKEMDRNKMVTRIYNLQYAKTDDVVAKLKPKIDDKKVGMVVGDQRSGQVVVTALPQRLQEMDDLIKSLDKKTKEVMIEIRILKLILNPQYDLGINWEKAFSNSKNQSLQKLDFRGAFPISSAISSASTLGTVGKIAFGSIGVNAFAVELKALKQINDSKILANPRLTVIDGEESKIHIGDTLAYVTTATTTGSSTSTTAETVNFVDIGIQLSVTPKINDDGYVTIKIKPEISSKTGDYTTPSGNKIPLINKTLAETNVMVKDGTTIVIGGLRKDERSRSKSGLPLLMDIPFVGGIFSTVEDKITKTEIVIFLTPHITGGDLNITDEKGRIKEGMKEY